jgi:Aspartyl protease/Domain of unknown function (DUF4124)
MKSFFAAAAILALQGRALAQQKIYQWIDPDGNIHISDHPTEQQTRPRQPDAPAKPAAATAPAAPESPPKPIELPYVALEGAARRVIVNVRFNGRVAAPLALDTGSPGMIISASLAQKLDLFSRDQGKLIVLASGIGGDAPAVRTILENVEIGGAVERFVPVTVTNELSDAFSGVVGMDFMGEYAMTIDPKRSVVVLQPQVRGSDAPGGHNEHWWRANFAEFRAARDKWRNYRDALELAATRSATVDGLSQEEFNDRRALARVQARESETLLSRLDSYASSLQVPRHWR